MIEIGSKINIEIAFVEYMAITQHDIHALCARIHAIGKKLGKRNMKIL